MAPSDIRSGLVQMTLDLGFSEALRWPADAASRLVQQVELSMPQNPYHSFQHVYDVAQCMHTLLTRTGLAPQQARGSDEAGRGPGLLQPLEMAALWCACLCHDLGHPGHSSGTESALGGPLHAAHAALDRSSEPFRLEWYHAKEACQLIRELGLLSALEPEEAERFEALLVALIDATDLQNHQKLCQEFAATAAAVRNSGHPGGAQERLQLMQCLLKCADLANTLRPKPYFQNWEEAIFEEFHREGDLLVARGLVAPENLPAQQVRRQGKNREGRLIFLRASALPTFECLEELVQAMPGLLPEMVMECTALLRARIAATQESIRSIKQPRRRLGLRAVRAALLKALLLLIPGVLLARWSPLNLSPPMSREPCFAVAPWTRATLAGPAFSYSWWVPPPWGLLCGLLLVFPLLTLWEISHMDLNSKQKLEQEAAEPHTVPDPLVDLPLGGGLGVVLVEFAAGEKAFDIPAQQRRRRSVCQGVSAMPVGHGQQSRSWVRRKLIEHRRSVPEEVMHGIHWRLQQHEDLLAAASGNGLEVGPCKTEVAVRDTSPCAEEAESEPEADSEPEAVMGTTAQPVNWASWFDLKVCALCFAMVVVSVVNKVLFRIVLASVGRYVHALSSTTNLAYLSYSWATVLAKAALASPERRSQLRGALGFAREQWRLFASIGVCESVAFTLMPLGAPGLPKALVPVIAQLTLPMSMALNTCLLGRRYSVAQALGVVLILLGIAMAAGGDWTTASLAPGQQLGVGSLGKPLFLTTLSYFFLVLSLIFKDTTFILSSKQEKQLDIFLLEGLAGLGQGAALLLQWPMNFALLTQLAPRHYFAAVAEAFSSAAGLMPGLILIYWSGNILYRLVTLTALKRLSSITTLLANVLTVPLSAMVFCIPMELPLIGPPDKLSMLLVSGSLVVCAGLVTFNLRWPCRRS